MRTRDKIRLEKKLKQQKQPELAPVSADSDKVQLVKAYEALIAERDALAEASQRSHDRVAEAFKNYSKLAQSEEALRGAVNTERSLNSIKLERVNALLAKALKLAYDNSALHGETPACCSR